MLMCLIMFYVTMQFFESKRWLPQFLAHPTFILIAFILILVSFFIITLRFVQKNIFSPLEELKKAAEYAKSGHYSYPIKEHTNDEIGDLFRTFDLMRERLKKHLHDEHQQEKKRKRLIASICHDLRTPLTSIKGYVEALQDGIATTKESQDEYLRIIHEKTKLLDHLIDDLSIFIKEDAGEFTLNMERIHTGRLLNEYLNQKVTDFQRSPIRLTLKKPFISTYIMADSYRIIQILDNLIGNAQKYARHEVTVSTRVSQYILYIDISDDGQGIPHDLLNNIFDPFFMVNKQKDQKEKRGSGLGLSIVKSLSEAHGGNVTVESMESVGTCFTFSIPLA